VPQADADASVADKPARVDQPEIRRRSVTGTVLHLQIVGSLIRGIVVRAAGTGAEPMSDGRPNGGVPWLVHDAARYGSLYNCVLDD
jgi:hypothetical protein